MIPRDLQTSYDLRACRSCTERLLRAGIVEKPQFWPKPVKKYTLRGG